MWYSERQQLINKLKFVQLKCSLKDSHHLIIVNSHQEKERCIAPIHNFVIPMLNKWTLQYKQNYVIRIQKET